jgi:hypothetical protein
MICSFWLCVSSSRLRRNIHGLLLPYTVTPASLRLFQAALTPTKKKKKTSEKKKQRQAASCPHENLRPSTTSIPRYVFIRKHSIHINADSG